jgi:hypothetical protein
MVVIKNKTEATVASFTLNKDENYMFSGGINVTGYTATSTKPVGVMSYSKCKLAPGANTACDNILEFLLPNRLLGTKFLSKSIGRNGRLSITATQGGTEVKVDGASASVLSNAGDTYNLTQAVNTAYIIETSAPV